MAKQRDVDRLTKELRATKRQRDHLMDTAMAQARKLNELMGMTRDQANNSNILYHAWRQLNRAVSDVCDRERW